jgi:hypothetical protein
MHPILWRKHNFMENHYNPYCCLILDYAASLAITQSRTSTCVYACLLLLSCKISLPFHDWMLCLMFELCIFHLKIWWSFQFLEWWDCLSVANLCSDLWGQRDNWTDWYFSFFSNRQVDIFVCLLNMLGTKGFAPWCACLHLVTSFHPLFLKINMYK